MGYTSTHRESGITNAAFFARELGDRYELLATASIANCEFYAALRDKETEEVCALVVLFQWTRDHYNFTYKEMTDSAGPRARRCPERILKLLTPAEERFAPDDPSLQYATEWFADCQAYNERKKRASRVKPGQTIEFPQPIEFTSGASLSRLRLVGRNTFSDPDHPSRRYRIPGWRAQPFSIAKEPNN